MGYEIRNDDSFSISENIWDSVYGQDEECSIFQSYWWNRIFYDSFCTDFKLNIISFYKRNECVAIFPLIERICAGKRVLEFIGSRMVDYLSPIVKNEHRAAIYKAFKEYVDEEGLFFYAYDINYNHSLSRFFTDTVETVKICYFEKGRDIPQGVIKEYEYDKRFLSRKYDNRIERSTNIKDYYNHVNLYLDNMEELRNHHIDDETRFFWRKYVFQNRSDLACERLIIDGEDAYSILYGIKGSTLYLINYAFNTKFKKYAPGKILLVDLMKKYSGKYTIDFSRGEDEYKARLGCKVGKNVKTLYPGDEEVCCVLNDLEYKIGFFPHKIIEKTVSKDI